MNKPTKIIEWTTKGELQITVENTDSLVIPLDGKKVDIGEYAQKTIQRVTDVEKFKAFILDQEKQLKEQINHNEEELKNLEKVDEAMLSEEQLNVLNKDIPSALKALFAKDAPKDTKRLASDIRKSLMKLTSLDKAVKDITKKKTCLGARKFFNDQLKELMEDKKIVFKN